MTMWRLSDALSCFIHIYVLCFIVQFRGAIAAKVGDEETNLLTDIMHSEVLSAIRGSPLQLSFKEIEYLRRGLPKKAEKLIELMNNVGLQHAVSTGQVDKRTFKDLRKSLVFLRTGNCHMHHIKPQCECAVIEKNIRLPKTPVVKALLSAAIIKTSTMMRINLVEDILVVDDTPLFEKEVGFGIMSNVSTPTKRIYKRPRQIYLDVTETIRKFQHLSFNERLPLMFHLRCEMEVVDPGNRSSSVCPKIFWPGSQFTLQMYTKPLKKLINWYSKRSKRERSFETPEVRRQITNGCLGFNHSLHAVYKCCRFRHTINAQQLPPIIFRRFIVFPHGPQWNLCDGRCLGSISAIQKQHTLRLNRFYNGLSTDTQEKLCAILPCCAANETADYTLLYMDRNTGLQLKVLPQAMKTTCSCS